MKICQGWLLIAFLFFWSSVCGFKELPRRFSRICRFGATNNNPTDPTRTKGFSRNSPQGSSKSSKWKNPSMMERNWKSGNLFLQSSGQGRRRAHEPWWMREDEANNPDMLPQYRPWWLINNCRVDDSWSLSELVEEAGRRSLDTTGSKAALLSRINESHFKFALLDENFTEPIIVDSAVEGDRALAPCYPEVYESNQGKG
jgi:hypothetical protein|eukprot:gene6181-6651_t